jgi:hypothetical protein
MRFRRGIVVLLTFVAFVLVFAGLATAGASATHLCKEAPVGPNECPVNQGYAIGQVFQAKAVNPTLASITLGVTQCETSFLEAKLTKVAASVKAELEVTQMTFFNCERSGTKCSMAVANPLPLGVDIESTGGGNGKTYLAPSKEAFVLEGSCVGFPFTCKWDATDLIGTMVGGDPAELSFIKSVLGPEKTGCGMAEVTIVYKSSNPKPVWVTE